MTTAEPGAVEREAELEKLRRRMRRAARRGDAEELERLSALYAAQKAEHVVKVHEEHIAERRAVRAAVRAQEARERPKPWRLPPGFGRSPLARERDRSGGPREEPRGPEGGLRPWRRYGGAMSDVIWRP